MQRIRQDTRGVSNVIVFVLGLVIIVIIVANVFLWNYEMNQLDWEKMKEDIKITDVEQEGRRAGNRGTKFTFQNKGSLTSHLVSLWVNNSTHHQRYDINIFVNSGDTISYIRNDISLPNEPYTVKVVTERGNIAIYSES